MTLTQTYTADDGTQFHAGVEVQILNVSDNYITKQCDVVVSFTSDTVDAARGIGSFSYTDTWEDSDVWAYIQSVMS